MENFKGNVKNVLHGADHPMHEMKELENNVKHINAGCATLPHHTKKIP